MKIISGLFITTLAIFARAQQSNYGQCGGINWTGGTTCNAGWTCQYQNPYYSQCLPAPAPTTTTTTTKTTSTPPGSTPTNPAARLRFAGVNIAGFDFGCNTTGYCNLNSVTPASNAAGQMSHFVNDDHLNIFRLPVGWQYLVNNQLGGTLNSNNMAAYDAEVQSCLRTGAYCIIDIHNYARWNGGIIGQGGPSNAQFTSLWSQLASKYASQNNIIFGIMNEPHDLPNISTWAQTVQAVVTAIRNAGANSQMILLPGNDYTSAASYVSSGSLNALQSVVNPDGSTNNLIFDIHQYLDSDSSGQSTQCVTNNINVFSSLASSLRSIKRQALLSETGGGNTASCEQYLCQQIQFLNQNSDVYLGFTSWAAGSFGSGYNLVETPTQNSAGQWSDTALVSACIAR